MADFKAEVSSVVVDGRISVQVKCSPWMFRLIEIPDYQGKPSGRLIASVFFNTGLKILPRCSHEEQYPLEGDYWQHVDAVRGTLPECVGKLFQWLHERFDGASAFAIYAQIHKSIPKEEVKDNG